jgi:hypothetical protein
MQEQARENDPFFTESPEEDIAGRRRCRDGHVGNSPKKTTRNCERIAVYCTAADRCNLLYPLFREVSFHVLFGKKRSLAISHVADIASDR